MTLSKALEASLTQLPGGLAAGFVDLSTGTLASYYSKKDLPQEFMNVVSTAVCELINAPIVRILNEIWDQDSDEEIAANKPFGEILLFGHDHTVLIKKIEDLNNAAMIYVAHKDTPAGVILMHVRSSIREIKKHLNDE